MIYHCAACPSGPCHALHQKCAYSNPNALRKGLCPLGHSYRWVECDCKATSEQEEDRRADGGMKIDPDILRLFDALLS